MPLEGKKLVWAPPEGLPEVMRRVHVALLNREPNLNPLDDMLAEIARLHDIQREWAAATKIPGGDPIIYINGLRMRIGADYLLTPDGITFVKKMQEVPDGRA